MSKRNTMLAIAIAAVALIAIGAFVVWGLPGPDRTPEPVEPAPATETVNPTVTPEPEPVPNEGPDGTPSEPSATRTVRVYFVRDEKVGVGGRVLTGADAGAPASAAVRALLAGPTAEEREFGLGTAVPTGVTLNGITVRDGLATVDLSKGFASGGGSLSMQLRAAQVVFTLTQFPTIDRVAFELEGTRIAALGGEGVKVGPSVTRADFEGVAPAILVESPYPGQTVDRSFTVSGSSNVFEATHQLQVTEPEGRIVHDRYVTATSGTGTRGTWSQQVTVKNLSRDGMGSVIVFEYSAKDGSRINIVEVPVRFER